MSGYAFVFSYTYTPRKLLSLAGMSMLLAAFFSYRAVGNDRGLIIERSIHLGVEGATRFYWVFAGIGLLGLIFFVAILLTRKRYPRRVTLASEYLVVPTSQWPFSMSERIIRYDAIRELRTWKYPGTTHLRVIHKEGSVLLDALRFESKAAFLTFCDMLETRRLTAYLPRQR